MGTRMHIEVPERLTLDGWSCEGITPFTEAVLVGRVVGHWDLEVQLFAVGAVECPVDDLEPWMGPVAGGSPQLVATRSLGRSADGVWAWAVCERHSPFRCVEQVLLRRAPLPQRETIGCITELCRAVTRHAIPAINGWVSPHRCYLSGNGTLQIAHPVAAVLYERTLACERQQRGEAPPWWWAPERSAPGSAVPASDVYALCALLHYLLTGVPPGSPAGAGRPVPEPVRELLERGLDPDPARRLPSLMALIKRLEGEVLPRLLADQQAARAARIPTPAPDLPEPEIGQAPPDPEEEIDEDSRRELRARTTRRVRPPAPEPDPHPPRPKPRTGTAAAKRTTRPAPEAALAERPTRPIERVDGPRRGRSARATVTAPAPGRPWMWILVGGAVVAGGILIWLFLRPS